MGKNKYRDESNRRHSIDDGPDDSKVDKKFKITDNNENNINNKIESSLDLTDLGAGYVAEDKKVTKAIQFYEEKLLPFIKENYELFKYTNYLSIKGYGTGLTRCKRPASN